jgi:membrane protease subunit (stomatin/prohibitin family)
VSLWSKLSGEFVDIVEFPDASADNLVYRFPRYANEIKFGAKLIVREGQGALFVNEGKLADVFTPGTYTLETRNLPILSTLQG